MMPKVTFICLLFFMTSLLLADITYGENHTYGVYLYPVQIVEVGGNTFDGYICLYPPTQEQHTYQTRPLYKGSDILNIVLQNYAQVDTLVINTVLIRRAEHNFVLNSSKRYIPKRQIAKIILQTNTNPDEYTNASFVYIETDLSDAEYQALQKPIVATLTADSGVTYDMLLISTNPRYTQLDLYLYILLMASDADNSSGIHPYLSSQGIARIQGYINDLVQDFDITNIPTLRAELKKCRQSWLTMAKYLENSQSIEPTAKSESINRLQNLAKQCDLQMADLLDVQTNSSFPVTPAAKAAMSGALYDCLFPHLRIPARQDIDWSTYLLQRGIVYKYFIWD